MQGSDYSDGPQKESDGDCGESGLKALVNSKLLKSMFYKEYIGGKRSL